LIEAVLLLFFAPNAFATRFIFGDFIPKRYPLYFTFAVSLVFCLALAVAVWTMPRRAEIPSLLESDSKESKAIKGLRPFEFNDAEIFTRLQRQKDLEDCIEAITSQSFQFGILVGESGCGKTSFLQAGVWASLTNKLSDYQAIYVRIDARKPTDSIREAVLKQFNLPVEALISENLSEILTSVLEFTGKSTVLLLDQFEQFFTQFKRQEDRAPFIAELHAWYLSEHLTRVKILISIRSDFYSHIIEILQTLNHSLSPSHAIQIKKFEPGEAVKILKVIAETEGIFFDETSVMKIAEQELGNREDGLISPVNLQILALMIDKQRVEERRAFSRSALEKFGGIEGLFSRFLERQLLALPDKKDRESAVRVLLALTDMEKNVRAGTLTIDQLQTKMQEQINAAEVTRFVEWLARGDVRLITPIEQDQGVAYELVHERLIPAVLEFSRKMLTKANQATLLLERRVNEWLGNQRNSHYLLNIRELVQITRQKPYLYWGIKKVQKEELIKASWKRLHMYIRLVVEIALLGIIWLVWWLSPIGQIHQVRLDLKKLSNKATASSVVEAFVKEGNLHEAKSIIDIEDKIVPQTKITSKILLSKAYLVRGNFEEAIRLVEEALNDIEELSHPFFETHALGEITTTIGKIKNIEQRKRLFSKTLNISKGILTSSIFNPYNANWKYHDVVGKIAHDASKLEYTDDQPLNIEQLIEIADDIIMPSFRWYSLGEIASALPLLSDEAQAFAMMKLILNKIKESGLNRDLYHGSLYYLPNIISAISSFQNKEFSFLLLQQLTNLTRDTDYYNSSSIISNIIGIAFDKIDNQEYKYSLIHQLISIASNISDVFRQNSYLIQTAKGIEKLDDEKDKYLLIQRLISLAFVTENPVYKADALANNLILMSKLRIGEARAQALGLIETLNLLINEISEQYIKSILLSKIALASHYLGEDGLSKQLFKDSLKLVDDIKESYLRRSSLVRIARNSIKVDDISKAYSLLDSILLKIYETQSETNVFADSTGISEGYIDQSTIYNIVSLFDKTLSKELVTKISINLLNEIEKIDDPINRTNVLSSYLFILSNSSQYDDDQEGKVILFTANWGGILEESIRIIERLIEISPASDVGALDATFHLLDRINSDDRKFSYLMRLLDLVDEMKDPSRKITALSMSVRIAEDLGKDSMSKILRQVLEINEKFNSPVHKSGVIGQIATSLINEKDIDNFFLDSLRANLAMVVDSGEILSTTSIISVLAASESYQGNWLKARLITNFCPTVQCRIESLSKIIHVNAEKNVSDLVHLEINYLPVVSSRFLGLP
jgi:hypothetical protein